MSYKLFVWMNWQIATSCSFGSRMKKSKVMIWVMKFTWSFTCVVKLIMLPSLSNVFSYSTARSLLLNSFRHSWSGFLKTSKSSCFVHNNPISSNAIAMCRASTNNPASYSSLMARLYMPTCVKTFAYRIAFSYKVKVVSWKWSCPN